ncbi:sensor histidine kinase [Clostridiales bacterium]|nr:sensor histidine kinase [Clostridiales bacterium]
MNMFFDYLKSHKKLILIIFVWVVIFALVLFLSNVPVDAALYAGLLCLIVGIAAAAYDFYHFCRQCGDLRQLLESIDAQVDHLPEPRNQIHEAYTEIIKELHRQKREVESRTYVEKKELMDYFTLWAHQIKTPLSAMSLILQNKGSWAGEEDREMAMELFNVEEYVNTAMSYVRVQDMASDLVFENVSLDDLIRRTVKKYASIFIRKKIRMDFQETGYQVATDEKWMMMVLEQILSNALKYTEAGGSISIYMKGTDLMIQDTGIGIRAEDLPRIFEKGFTGENGRRHSQSTGQGLYLCRTIMDRLGHDIRVESQEGEGTTVILDLEQEALCPGPS